MGISQRPLTPLEGIISGSLAGAAEVTVNQPFIFFKNCLQVGKPIDMNPISWYRGYGVNVASLAPITAIQVSCSQIFRSLLFKSDNSTTAQAVSAFAAGAVSGLISGPSECIIVNQQVTGAGVRSTCSSIFSEAGLRGVLRGTSFACLRDASFTAGYVAFAPMIANELMSMMQKSAHSDPSKISETTKMGYRILAGILVGGVVGVASHPFDTYKTVLQRDYASTKYKSTFEVIKTVKPFNGLLPRLTRVAIGVCVLSTVNSMVTDYFLAQDGKKQIAM